MRENPKPQVVSREDIARLEMRIMSVKSDIISDSDWRRLIDSHEAMREVVEAAEANIDAWEPVRDGTKPAPDEIVGYAQERHDDLRSAVRALRGQETQAGPTCGKPGCDELRHPREPLCEQHRETIKARAGEHPDLLDTLAEREYEEAKRRVERMRAARGDEQPKPCPYCQLRMTDAEWNTHRCDGGRRAREDRKA